MQEEKLRFLCVFAVQILLVWYFLQSSAAAVFDGAGEGPSDPAAAGRGGIQILDLREIASSLQGNPAGLSGLEAASFSLLTGASPGGEGTGALLAAGGPSAFGGWGAGFRTLREPALAGLQVLEGRAGGALSFSRNFQAGLVFRAWRASFADSGASASSFGPDFGILLKPSLPRRFGKLAFGAGLGGFLSTVRWNGGGKEPAARTLRVGLSYSPVRSVFLAAERGRLEYPGTLFASDEDRIGAELRPPGPAVLRGGWSRLAGGATRISAGLGLRYGSWRLDYALTLENQSSVRPARHQAGLEWVFGQAAGPTKIKAGVLAEGPESPVFFDIERDKSRPVTGWEAVLRDDHGKAVKVWKGKGAPPVQLLWDGRDDQGRASPNSGKLEFEMRLDGEERETLRSSLKRGEAQRPENLRLLDLGSAAPSRPGGEAGEPRWKAELTDSSGKVVGTWAGTGAPPKDLGLIAKDGLPGRAGASGPLSFNLTTDYRDGRTETRRVPKVEISDRGGLEAPRPRAGAAKEWQIEIRAKDGSVVKTFQGTGAPPPQIAWDGVSERGRRTSGGGLEFVMRTTESSGEVVEKTRSLEGPGEGGLTSLSLPRAGADPILAWAVLVDDPGGRRLKTYSGDGPPPGSLLVPSSFVDEGDEAPRLSAKIRVRRKPSNSAVNRAWAYDRGDWRELLKPEDTPAPAAPRTAELSNLPPEAPPGSTLIGVFYFVYNDSFTMAEDAAAVKDILTKIRRLRNPTLYVCGHSDSRGPADWEDWLSRLRAEEVWEKIRRKAGPGVQGVIRSFGSRRRILDEAGLEDQPASRRVNVYLAPRN